MARPALKPAACYGFCGSQCAGKGKMQIIPAARSVHIEQLARQVQSVKQAGLHRFRRNIAKNDAAVRDLCVGKALRTDDVQAEIRQCAAKAFKLSLRQLFHARIR